MHGAVALLISSIAVSAGPTRPEPKAARASERPRAVAVIPKPRQALPRFREKAERIFGKGSAAQMFGAEAVRAGFDLSDPVALDKVGVAVDLPIWIIAPRRERAPIMVLTLSKPELTDAAFGRALGSTRRLRALSATSSAKALTLPTTGLVSGPAEDPSFMVWRSGTQLFVRPSRTGAPTSERDSLDLAVTFVKPPLPTLTGPREPDALVLGEGAEGVDTFEAGVWFEADAIEVRSDLHLDFTTGLLMGELASAASPSKPLVAWPDPAAELTAVLPPSLITAGLDGGKLSVEHARVLDGKFHAVLSRGGTLAVVAGLAPGARDESVSALSKALVKESPQLRVERVSGHLVASFDGADKEAALAAVTKPSAEGARAPAELRVRPKLIFDALAARTRARQGPALPATQVAFARFLASDVVRAASEARVELSFGPRIVRLLGRLELDP